MRKNDKSGIILINKSRLIVSSGLLLILLIIIFSLKSLGLIVALMIFVLTVSIKKSGFILLKLVARSAGTVPILNRWHSWID